MHRTPLRLLPPARTALALSLLGLAACGGEDEAGDTLPVAEAPAAPAQAAQAASPPAAGEGTLAVADLDLYERGVRAEIQAVEQAREELQRARSGTDTLTAMSNALPQQTEPIGARAAGVPLERYRAVSSNVEEVLQTRTQSAMAAAMPSMDTTGLPPEVRAQVRENLQIMQQMGQAEERAYAALPPELAGAFRERAPRLDSLRLHLVGLRLRAMQ